MQLPQSVIPKIPAISAHYRHQSALKTEQFNLASNHIAGLHTNSKSFYEFKIEKGILHRLVLALVIPTAKYHLKDLCIF